MIFPIFYVKLAKSKIRRSRPKAILRRRRNERNSKTRPQLLLEIEGLRTQLDVAQQRLQEADERIQAGKGGRRGAVEAFGGTRDGMEERQKTLATDLARANEQLVASGEILEERLKFETLLAEISARFVNLPADRIDSEIEDAQRRICELLDLDRSTLWQVCEGEPGTLLLTHLHQPPGSPTAS